MIAQEYSQRLGFDCMAYDFINDQSGNPRIVEISYNFVPDAVNECFGYWDVSGKFQQESAVNVQELILNNLLTI